MGFVAQQHLLWGDRMVAPGEAVPSGEPGRDYGLMLTTGQVVFVPDQAAPAHAPVHAEAAPEEHHAPKRRTRAKAAVTEEVE